MGNCIKDFVGFPTSGMDILHIKSISTVLHLDLRHQTTRKLVKKNHVFRLYFDGAILFEDLTFSPHHPGVSTVAAQAAQDGWGKLCLAIATKMILHPKKTNMTMENQP